MTYANLKLIINADYAQFSEDYVKRQTIAADDKFSHRELFFVKTIWKVLMAQDGDETLDTITKVNIQDCIRLFNKVANKSIPIEYT